MKLKRYQIVPLLLAAYAIFMTIYFGLDLLRSGQSLRFYSTLSAETIVIILAYFFLRKKDRNNDTQSTPPQHQCDLISVGPLICCLRTDEKTSLDEDKKIKGDNLHGRTL